MDSLNLEKGVTILIAILLFLCILDMPYGYYELVRFLSFIGFSYLAKINHSKGNDFHTYLFAALALLFQPFMKIALGRLLWNIIDIVVGVYLLLTLNNKNNQELKE